MGDLGDLGELTVELDFDPRRWRLSRRLLLENHFDGFATLSGAILDVAIEILQEFSELVTTYIKTKR